MSLPVRKLCSCNAVLCPPEEAAAAPDTSLFGVILLNSPANTAADFDEYIRLYELHRGPLSGAAGAATTTSTTAPAPAASAAGDGGGGGRVDVATSSSASSSPAGASPYFICADGAYAALKRHCATRFASSSSSSLSAGDSNARAAEVPDAGAGMALRLCDVLIGDMDSLSSTQLSRVAAVAGAADDVKTVSPLTTDSHHHEKHETDAEKTGPDMAAGLDGIPRFHEKVSTIPVALLEVVRRRRDDALRHRSNPAAPRADAPVVLPITCQMSTDFHKAVALLERLQRLEQGNTDTLAEDEQGAYYLSRQTPDGIRELAEACAALLPRAMAESERQADGDAAEAERCRALLKEVSHAALPPASSSSSSSSSLASTAAAAAAEEAAPCVQTQVLPNVAVLGALGGRIDHEMGAMVCVLRFAKVFNLLVVNTYNVLFACWPDGVTQLLMPPSWQQQSNLSTDPAEQLAAPEQTNPYMCGLVPYGPVREMETVGCLWNVVKNRPGVYDGFTQTEQYRFSFDGLVSVCNTVSSCVVTLDLRPRGAGEGAERPAWDPAAPSVNPPAVFMLGRPKPAKKAAH